jgi:hypothetical protein
MDSEEQLLNNAHLCMTCISETGQCLPRVVRSCVRAPVGPNQKLKKQMYMLLRCKEHRI